MSDPALKIDVAEWVERARADPVAYRQRQTVEITLNAIAMTAPLNAEMFLKGGILMGLAYGSPRLTADIDLTTNRPADSNVGEMIQTSLDSAFPRAAAVLGYADLVVKTHSVKEQPKQVGFENADFPALKLKIAYAQRGTLQEKALQQGKTPGVIDVDISFNEPLTQIQVLELTGGRELRAYGLVELIAEKYRAMLQQDQRGRNRRQDVYDLDQLIAGNEIDDACREQILDVFIAKCQSRRLEPTYASLDGPEIKKRSSVNWQTMELELDELPDFESCFARVSEFYRNLPWGCLRAAALETDPERRGHAMQLTKENIMALRERFVAVRGRGKEYFVKAAPEKVVEDAYPFGERWEIKDAQTLQECEALRQAIKALSVDIAAAARISPMLADADMQELRHNTRQMLANVHFREYRHTGVYVHHDEDMVLGVDPPTHEELPFGDASLQHLGVLTRLRLRLWT